MQKSLSSGLGWDSNGCPMRLKVSKLPTPTLSETWAECQKESNNI